MTETSLPPGPSLPVWAQTMRWVVRAPAFMEECRRRYGDTFTVRIRQEGTWVFLTDPEDVKRVFTGSAERLHAGEANDVLRPVLGSESVLLLDEQPHMRNRKLMLPPFHGERMKGYGDLMREVTERELDRFPIGEPFSVWEHTQAITLEIIVRAVFGIGDPARISELQGRLKPLLEFTTKPRRMFALALLGPDRLAEARLTGFPQAREGVDELLFAEIRARRGDPDLAERDDILSMLLGARDEDGEPLSDTELRDQLMTLLVAGHETTATALAWTFERLVRHPEVLARAQEEAAGESRDYIDAVIKETLRLRPILPLVVRRLTEPAEFGGRLLPAGATVAPCIYLMHRRPDIYPEPHRFRPERFLEQPPGTYTWIPFGGGVRRCLGASFALFEMSVVLSTILRAVHLRAADSSPERISRRAITFYPRRGGELIADRLEGASSSAPVRAAVAA